MWTDELQKRYIKATKLQYDISKMFLENPSRELLKSLKDVSDAILSILEQAGYKTGWSRVLEKAEDMLHEGKLESFEISNEDGI